MTFDGFSLETRREVVLDEWPERGYKIMPITNLRQWLTRPVYFTIRCVVINMAPLNLAMGLHKQKRKKAGVSSNIKVVIFNVSGINGLPR